ncbi:ATP-dependent dethiobiotin synthetase BioD [Shewanella sp. NFH-SH190041]|nr:ATP-dependent dethiobiotin synthetase BioD [Shewanella sp. NFH-SH190041]
MIYFVTGTDTDSGKTLVSSALLHLASQLRHQDDSPWQTLGIKPVASGCEQTAEGLRNSDALALQAQSSVQLDYRQVNPFSFTPAIAPHIVAAQEGVDISPEALHAALDIPRYQETDFTLIEGAGGWRLPLGNQRMMPELVQTLQLPVILVVGMKLGCLNHAVLTQEAILADGLQITGWVANQVDGEMQYVAENLAELTELMSAPCLGVIPHLASPQVDVASEYLTLPHLLRHNGK